jgi:hypothetical protein
MNAACFAWKRETSNRVIARIADLPERAPAQNAPTPSPKAVTAPIPVTTTPGMAPTSSL